MTRGGVWLCVVMAAGGLVACVTNHAALEKRPDNGHGGSSLGGASGLAGRGPVAGTGGDPTSGGGHADDEPPGTSRLTFVNGVVDAPSVLVCLARVDSDGTVEPFGEPLTGAPLDYAQSVTLEDIPGIDLDVAALQPILIAGDWDLVAGLGCAEAIERARSEEVESALPPDSAQGGAAGANAGATASAEAGSAGSSGSAGEGGSAGAGGPAPRVRPALRARGLPQIPAGTLTRGFSLALVANGCLGGATFTGADAELYCGAGYTEQEPTVSAVLVNLSRVVAFDHVGIQVVHASLANAGLDVRTRAPFLSQEPSVSIVSNLSRGQVGPRPASLLNTVADLGSARLFGVEVAAQGNALFSEGWADVLASGGLSELAKAHTYALVVSGPRGDLKAVPELWNAPAITAIAVDPD